MTRFTAAAFFTAATEPENLPPPQGAEVALAGRSNAGKSSVINALVRRNRLAFVSKTPGRTQQIVFFQVGDAQFLVDLPGYGYAKVPNAVKRQWEALLSAYLRERDSLRGIVVVIDARHPLTPLDWQLLEWLAPRGRPIHVVLTKADKLSRSEAAATLAQVKAKLGYFYPDATVQLFSSPKGHGVEELEARISAWLTGKQVDHK